MLQIECFLHANRRELNEVSPQIPFFRASQSGFLSPAVSLDK
jgi:hypothetical protein